MVYFVILALVLYYQFEKCKSVDLYSTTSSEVVCFSTKFSNRKTLREISVIGLDMYCYKVSVAANGMTSGGVFIEFGLSKLVT